MALLPRLGRVRRLSTGRISGVSAADSAHLAAFVRAHGSAEVYIEPRTPFIPTTLLLVAPSGAWTRRRVADPGSARRFARSHRLALFDVAVTGYPQRMRDWSAWQRDRRQDDRRQEDGRG